MYRKYIYYIDKCKKISKKVYKNFVDNKNIVIFVS